MKKILILLLAINCFTNTCKKKNDAKYMIYNNDEIEIEFTGSYMVLDNGNFYSHLNDLYQSGYFHDFENEIRFQQDSCYKNPKADNDDLIPVQAVTTTDGYLSSFYILPEIEENKLIEEIEKAFKPVKSLSSYSGISIIDINNFKVIKWLAQIGKSRYYHYILKAGKHYYLFVSSPYGNSEYIEGIISKIKLIN